jgi:hypothetical protein
MNDGFRPPERSATGLLMQMRIDIIFGHSLPLPEPKP